MKKLNLSEQDRGMLKICFNNDQGEEDDLALYLVVAPKLELEDVEPDLTVCSSDPESFELEDAEFKMVKRIFENRKKWPFAWAQFQQTLKARFDAVETVKSGGKKGKIVDLDS